MTCECEMCRNEIIKLAREVQEWKDLTALWRRKYGDCMRALGRRPGGN